MPKCIHCKFHDISDAEFSKDRLVCIGCMEKRKAGYRFKGFVERQVGDFSVLEKTYGDSCGECGSHSIYFVAWNGLEYYEVLLCASCNSIEEYLYPLNDVLIV